SCPECDQHFCLSHIYQCDECQHAFCRDCFTRHSSEGHWSDSDTADAMIHSVHRRLAHSNLATSHSTHRQLPRGQLTQDINAAFRFNRLLPASNFRTHNPLSPQRALLRSKLESVLAFLAYCLHSMPQQIISPEASL